MHSSEEIERKFNTEEEEDGIPQDYIVYPIEDQNKEANLSKEQLLYYTVERLPTETKEILQLLLLEEPRSVGWGHSELRPTNIPFGPAFELTNNTLVCLPQRRMPAKHNDTVEKKIDAVLAALIIKRITSREFPILIAKKKEGSARFCVDYWALNNKMKVDKLPLPNIEEATVDIVSLKIFSDLDTSSGYWHVRLA